MAREIRRHGEDPIFASTPPLESLRSVLGFAPTDLPGEPCHDRASGSDGRTQIMLLDISRAHCCAEHEADPRQVEKFVGELHLEGATNVRHAWGQGHR